MTNNIQRYKTHKQTNHTKNRQTKYNTHKTNKTYQHTTIQGYKMHIKGKKHTETNKEYTTQTKKHKIHTKCQEYQKYTKITKNSQDYKIHNKYKITKYIYNKTTANTKNAQNNT